MPETPSAMPPSMTAILAVLTADHGATVLDLAERAALGRSTTAKVLSGLHDRGLARRESTERTSTGRAADMWFATAAATPTQPEPADENDEPDTGPAPERESDEQDAPNPSVPSDAPEPAHLPETDGTAEPDNAPVDAEPTKVTVPQPETAVVARHPEPAAETAPDHEAVPEPAADPEPDAEQQPTEGEDAVAPPAAAPGSQPAAPAPARAAKAAAKRPATPAAHAAQPTGDERRLPKGGLRTMVADHLAGNPDLVITVSKLGKLLDRSSGAVANALDKLIELGAVEQVDTKPRTFRHHTPDVAA